MSGGPQTGTRWLLVRSDREQWVFPFLREEDSVVLAGAGTGAQLRLRDASPLAFYFEEVDQGIKLVRGYAKELKVDGAAVPDSVIIPPACVLEVSGQRFCLQVKILPPQSYPSVDDLAETAESPLQEDEPPTTVLPVARWSNAPVRPPSGTPEEEPDGEQTQILGSTESADDSILPVDSTPVCFGAPAAFDGLALRGSARVRNRDAFQSEEPPKQHEEPREPSESRRASRRTRKRQAPPPRRSITRLILGALALSFLLGGVAGGVTRVVKGPPQNDCAQLTGWTTLLGK